MGTSGKRARTLLNPAGAYNDQVDNGESSDFESALNNPYGLDIVIAKLHVAGIKKQKRSLS